MITVIVFLILGKENAQDVLLVVIVKNEEIEVILYFTVLWMEEIW